MREYAPVVTVVVSLCLLVGVAYTRITAPNPLLITVEPELAQALAKDQAKLTLLAANGQAKATVTRWEIRSGGRLAVLELAGPSQGVQYAYMLIDWSNGLTSFHQIDQKHAMAAPGP